MVRMVYKFWRPPPSLPLIPRAEFGDTVRLWDSRGSFMYWKNEVLSPLSEGNKILSDGIPTKQVVTLETAVLLCNFVRKMFSLET